MDECTRRIAKKEIGKLADKLIKLVVDLFNENVRVYNEYTKEYEDRKKFSIALRKNSDLGLKQFGDILQASSKAVYASELMLYILQKEAKDTTRKLWKDYSFVTEAGKPNNEISLARRMKKELHDVQNLAKGLPCHNQYPNETELMLIEKYLGYVYWAASIAIKGGEVVV